MINPKKTTKPKRLSGKEAIAWIKEVYVPFYNEWTANNPEPPMQTQDDSGGNPGKPPPPPPGSNPP